MSTSPCSLQYSYFSIIIGSSVVHFVNFHVKVFGIGPQDKLIIDRFWEFKAPFGNKSIFSIWIGMNIFLMRTYQTVCVQAWCLQLPEGVLWSELKRASCVLICIELFVRRLLANPFIKSQWRSGTYRALYFSSFFLIWLYASRCLEIIMFPFLYSLYFRATSNVPLLISTQFQRLLLQSYWGA